MLGQPLVTFQQRLDGLVCPFLTFEEALMRGGGLLLQALHAPQPFLNNLERVRKLSRHARRRAVLPDNRPAPFARSRRTGRACPV